MLLSPQSIVFREPFQMTTKVCTNVKCPAYAHFVYTVAMRCVLCRCDLQAAQVARVGLERTQPVTPGFSQKPAAAGR
jgi:hypothetical protein